MISRAILSALGIGFLPGPTGTWASAATSALLWALHGASTGPGSAGAIACVVAGGAATLALGGRAALAGGGDPRWVVTDEVAGQALATAIAGAVGRGSGLWAAVAAFVLFRALDIAKPGPIGTAERAPGGVGILADDLLAGGAAGGLVAAARALGLLG